MTTTFGWLGGSSVVVTGASRGIGKQIAIRLAALGADVGLWARDGNALQQVAAEIAEAGGRAYPYIVDVTQRDQIEQAADSMRARLPPLRVLVNNAGTVIRKPTVAISDAEWRGVLSTNLDGTFFVTRALLSDLTRSGGRIINIASRAGREGTAMLAAYCAAKHGVVGFTRALAAELRAAKVSVNAICPGSVDTAMLKVGHPGGKAEMSPDDVASTAVFLATPAPFGAPDALTGACIDVYG